VHGFCDDEETRRLLRFRPPQQALAWASGCLGGPVISARALRGGMSPALHLLTLLDSSGQRRQAVLRRYVRPELNAEEPDAVGREARALRVARRAGVPVPVLLAADPDGTGAGVPAVLMSRMPGRVDWWPPDTDPWPRRLAGVLSAIRAAPLPPAGVLPPFAPLPPAGQLPATRLGQVPARVGTGRGDQPRAAAPTAGGAAAPRLPPRQRAVAAGKVSGVVDWQDACTGPAAADVAHCRVNLLDFGSDAAQRFTASWQQTAGATHHPWGDIVTVIGFLDDLRGNWGPERNLVEELLAQAVAELGGNSR
jgi:hypothetical protein